MNYKAIIFGFIICILVLIPSFFLYTQNMQLAQITTSNYQLLIELNDIKSQINKINQTLIGNLKENQEYRTEINAITNEINNIKSQLNDIKQINAQLNIDKIALEKKYSDLFTKYSNLIGLYNLGTGTTIPKANWTENPPLIDGITNDKEWGDFYSYELKYSGSWDRDGGQAVSWDTKDKLLFLSILRDDKNIYICAKFNAKYLGSNIQWAYYSTTFYDSSNITDNRNILWDTEYNGGTYPYNTWLVDNVKIKSTGVQNTDYNMGGTNDGIGKFSHSSGGINDADGLYIIELELPLRGSTEDKFDTTGDISKIQVYYVENTKIPQNGDGKGEMWDSGQISFIIQ